MKKRFEVRASRDCGSRPAWYIVDSEGVVPAPARYRLRRQAQIIAARWNADPSLAEREGRDIRAQINPTVRL